MHRGGRPRLDGLDWSGRRATGSYSDSKLFVTALAAAVARLWPDALSNAVDPGWVPTRMGGQGAPDDLRLGHLTQEWLATSDDADARTSGGYWHHQRRIEPTLRSTTGASRTNCLTLSPLYSDAPRLTFPSVTSAAPPPRDGSRALTPPPSLLSLPSCCSPRMTAVALCEAPPPLTVVSGPPLAVGQLFA